MLSDLVYATNFMTGCVLYLMEIYLFCQVGHKIKKQVPASSFIHPTCPQSVIDSLRADSYAAGRSRLLARLHKLHLTFISPPIVILLFVINYVSSSLHHRQRGF